MYKQLPSNWLLKESAESQGFVQRLQKSVGLRGSAWQKFISLNFDEGFLNPWELPDMKKGVKRLVQAQQKNERILIYGDYDADGIPGASLLLKGLTNAGYKNVEVIIPTRLEGYGINIDRIKPIIKKFQLMITVDTGITAYSEIDFIKEQGVDVIVTDHHEILQHIPKSAFAVINPKRADSKYKYKELAGTAVAYKLLWALYEELGLDNSFLKWNIDLVAVATIADLMPLTGENRLLVHYGMQVLKKSRNRGLTSLMKLANIDQAKISTGSVSFGLAPRINAPSRLEKERVDSSSIKSENIAFTMLTADNYSTAFESAVIVNQLNLARRQIVQNEVEQIMQETKVPKGGGAFVVQNIPVGVIGLIASYLSQTSGWPCLVMTSVGNEIRGSGRSPTDLSILDLISKHDSLLVKYGGHKQAAGWTVTTDKVGEFCQAINKDLHSLAKKFPCMKKASINTFLQDHEATMANAKLVNQLAPFGVGNPQPLFLIATTVDAIKYMGQANNHLKIFTPDEFPEIVWFNAEISPKLSVGEKILALVYLEINNFNGERVQLNVQELIRSNEKN